MVRDDDVDLLRVGTRQLDEALLDDGALAAEAFVAGDRHLPPCLLRDAGHELVTIPRVGLVRPLAQPDDLAARATRVGVDLADTEQRVGVVVGVAARQLVLAQVVAPALDERVRRTPPEQRLEGIGEAWHVAVDDLRLQRKRRCRDDGRLVDVERVPDRGNEVGERLSGAGARLDEQVLARLDGVLDGLRHLRLAGARHPTHPTDGGRHELIEGGQFGHAPTLGQRVPRHRLERAGAVDQPAPPP